MELGLGLGLGWGDYSGGERGMWTVVAAVECKEGTERGRARVRVRVRVRARDRNCRAGWSWLQVCIYLFSPSRAMYGFDRLKHSRTRVRLRLTCRYGSCYSQSNVRL